MRKDIWSRRLEEVKKRETPETVLVVAGSAELTRVVIAWIGVRATRKSRLSSCKGTDDETTWRWLWENMVFPEDWFYNRIAGARKRAEQHFTVLVANRVLYPDGTINGFVERYLREKVLSLFGMAKKSKPAA
jgi:hypothetical protein